MREVDGTGSGRKQAIAKVRQSALTPPTPRIIQYHQTHVHKGQPVSILPLLDRSNRAAVTHVIIAAIHLNDPASAITLNDRPWQTPENPNIWTEVRELQDAGIRVLGMLGGAAKGSYERLDRATRTGFLEYYEPLREMVRATGLDGLDLDVEEQMSLAGIVRLIDQLKSDFGDDFIITLAPIATALMAPKIIVPGLPPLPRRNLSGFDYREVEKAMGTKIEWYNSQFYCGHGSAESVDDYQEILKNGFPTDKVVMGLITNPESEVGWVEDDVLREVLLELWVKNAGFAGVMGWEYFNSFTVAQPDTCPWSWAALMTEILRPEDSRLQETVGDD